MLKGIAIEPAAASGLTIGTSQITGGTNTRVLFDDSGVVGESAGLTYIKASGLLGSTAITTTGGHISRSATATPAAASGVSALTMGSAGIGIYWGTGSPSTALSAAQGSLYIRTDGGASTRLYINSDGSTAWAAVTSL